MSLKDKILENYPSVMISGDISRDHYCIVDSRVHGLFACFYCILYGLFICEREKLKPFIVLGRQHLYYDQNYGENIFNYFYEQEIVINNEMPVLTVINPHFFLSWCSISINQKIVSNYFIKKYFILKKELTKVIKRNLIPVLKNERILAVHYRGRDKIKETPLVDFDIYIQKIDFMFANNMCDKILFTSDELQFRNKIKKRYKERVIMYELEGNYKEDATSKEKGVHFHSLSPYFQAKDALIECYLLSKCHIFISSHRSSMSLFATFLNPDLIHIILEP